ncbi:AMP-binding protein [Amycolatopsis sp. NPDC048633]|uniref:AMP-binding protein n=1 Tax=Amycolatopsis sp. NPDC048633 TaxID=3157095 RepID=UPI0033DBC39E
MYPGIHAESFPDKPAVVLADTGERITYEQLDRNSLRLAVFFGETGLRRGDHIAMLVGNDPRSFEIYWAALRSGLYVTAVNCHSGYDEAAYVVDDCGAQALVVAAEFGELALRVISKTPRVRVRLALGGPVLGHDSYDEALESASDRSLPSQPRGRALPYSSGRTGRPKGVVTSLPDVQVDEGDDPIGRELSLLYDFDSDTVYLSPGPIHAAAPLRFCEYVHSRGGTVVLMKRFDAETALAIIDRYRVTHGQWVPEMFARLLQLSEPVRYKYDLSSLEMAIHAGAPCPVAVKQAMIDWWGPIVHEHYSSTECIGITCINSFEWNLKRGSVGRSWDGAVHVCRDDGTELPPGQVGLVYFDDTPFSYRNDKGKTQQSRHPWCPTWATGGDLGYLDEDGYLFLVGRSELVTPGGTDIHLEENEDTEVLYPAAPVIVEPRRGSSAGLVSRFRLPWKFDFAAVLPGASTEKPVAGELRGRYR